MNLTLKDFHVASAYRPYQPGGETYDICSYRAIKEVIDKGARFHFLDVWSSNPTNHFDNAAYPNVRNKTLMPEFGNALSFDKVCRLYRENSWVGTKYPLVLYLNLQHTAANNRFVLNKIARSLWNNFKGKFAGVEYAFARKDIGDIPIGNTLNKVIILTNVYPNEGQFQELVNGVISEKVQNAGSLMTHDQYKTQPNTESMTEFNRTHLGIIVPDNVKNVTNVFRPGIDLIQYSADEPMTKRGFQFTCMNYQKPGKERDEYVNFFNNSSLVLKDDKLRYIPCPKPVILKQNIKASYAPRNINFKDGYFSHSF